MVLAARKQQIEKKTSGVEVRTGCSIIPAIVMYHRLPIIISSPKTMGSLDQLPCSGRSPELLISFAVPHSQTPNLAVDEPRHLGPRSNELMGDVYRPFGQSPIQWGQQFDIPRERKRKAHFFHRVAVDLGYPQANMDRSKALEVNKQIK